MGGEKLRWTIDLGPQWRTIRCVRYQRWVHANLCLNFNRSFTSLFRLNAVNGKNGKPEGMVRVVNPVTGQRSLIRGKSNEVLDLQFAHMKSPILLASIEESALLVHRIETNSSNIVCTMMLIIEDPLADYTPKYDRISWCPSLADSDSDAENAGHMIVWTRGNVYQCYNTSVVVEHYGVGVEWSRRIPRQNFLFSKSRFHFRSELTKHRIYRKAHKSK